MMGHDLKEKLQAAAPALKPDLEFIGFFAIIGTYVGIIPVMIGILWLTIY